MWGVCACGSHDRRVQKRVLESSEQELQVVVGHPVWMLGTELGSFARTMWVINH